MLVLSRGRYEDLDLEFGGGGMGEGGISALSGVADIVL